MNTPADPPIRLLAKFEQIFSTAPQIVVQAPGREMWAAVRLNGMGHCTLYTADGDGRTTFTYQSAKRKQTIHHRPLPRWARYAAGATLYVDVAEMPGIDVVICGDEPAGPRYDHALGILFAALWHEVNRETCDPADLLEIAERARREYVEI